MLEFPTSVLADGLGHPEGPDALADGRIIFVETYASDVKVFEAGRVYQFGDCGGGPNACLMGSDGCVYVTQNGGVAGPWRAKTQVPPSIQKIFPNGKVEIIATKVDGVTLNAPNDLAFGPDGRLYFTDPGDWDEVEQPSPSRIFALNSDGSGVLLDEYEATYPNGIVAEPDGAVVWAESYTRRLIRRSADGAKQVVATLPEGHIPDGMKVDELGRFWVATVFGGVMDIIDATGALLSSVKTPFAPLNCTFAGTRLCVTDFGDLTTVGADAAFVGRLLSLDVGVSGRPVFRGKIG